MVTVVVTVVRTLSAWTRRIAASAGLGRRRGRSRGPRPVTVPACTPSHSGQQAVASRAVRRVELHDVRVGGGDGPLLRRTRRRLRPHRRARHRTRRWHRSGRRAGGGLLRRARPHRRHLARLRRRRARPVRASDRWAGAGVDPAAVRAAAGRDRGVEAGVAAAPGRPAARRTAARRGRRHVGRSRRRLERPARHRRVAVGVRQPVRPGGTHAGDGGAPADPGRPRGRSRCRPRRRLRHGISGGGVRSGGVEGRRAPGRRGRAVVGAEERVAAVGAR